MIRRGVLCFALWSGVAGAADLMRVYLDALANDPVYGSARATLEANRENFVQARANLLPTISASASSQRIDADVSQRISGSTVLARQFNTNTWMISLGQPLFRWQTWESYKQSELSVIRAESQFAQAVQDLIIRVAQAYFDILAAQDNLAFTVSQKDALSEQLVQAKRSFTVGKANIVDVYDAQARYDVTATQEVAAKNDLELKKRTLKQITGKYPDDLTPLKTSLTLSVPQPAVVDEWIARAEKESLTVRAQEATLEIAAREVSQQRGGHLPTLDFFANRGKVSTGNSTTTFIGSDVYSSVFGVQLAFPIFAGGATDSRVREAIANLEKARQDLEAARRAAALGATQSFLDVTNGVAQIEGLETALKSNQIALDANKQGYRVGIRINIDVLTALQQLFSTKRDLAKARYDAIVNGLKLRASAGALSERDIDELNRSALGT